jgi:FkbM family methyltransferase
MTEKGIKHEWIRRTVPPVLMQALRRDNALLGKFIGLAETEILWSLLKLAREGREENPWLDFFAYALAHAQSSHAQLYQDLFVLWSTQEKRNGYFVDIGACDGVLLSNTLLLEKEFGWQGIVAEPNPLFSKEIARNRHCHVSTRCVWSASGQKLAFKQVAEPEFSTLQSVDPQDAHEHRGVRKQFNSVEVETVSLNDLLLEANAPARMDFLSLDTEGSELDILGAFDFDTWSFDHICVEHNFTQRRASIHALLTGRGYRRVLQNISQWDDWYLGPKFHPA